MLKLIDWCFSSRPACKAEGDKCFNIPIMSWELNYEKTLFPGSDSYLRAANQPKLSCTPAFEFLT